MIILTQSQTHRINSALAAHGQKPGPGVRSVPRLEVELQKIGDTWMVIIGKGSPLPATDVEVELWIRLQEVCHD